MILCQSALDGSMLNKSKLNGLVLAPDADPARSTVRLPSGRSWIGSASSCGPAPWAARAQADHIKGNHGRSDVVWHGGNRSPARGGKKVWTLDLRMRQIPIPPLRGTLLPVW